MCVPAASLALRVVCVPRGLGAQTRAHVRGLTASLAHSLTYGLLGRHPRGAGAEEGGAGGDEEGAGEEEEEEQAAGDAGAAGSGELVGGNWRRGGRGRRRGDGRAGWGHGWRWCGRGRPGRYDVI